MRPPVRRRFGEWGASLLLFAGGCGAPAVDFETTLAAIRPDDPRAPSGTLRYDPGERVESWGSPGGRVRVHFSRAGRNAAPSVDADGSGVPDYVELTGATYDAVRALDHGTLGLLEPVSDSLLQGSGDGGDDRFDVYLVDFAGRGDGAFVREGCQPDAVNVCTGFMTQENDFTGYPYPSLGVAVRILASHEYFHAVQSAYDSDQDTVFTESTAVWATERFDPTLTDFEGFIGSYLSRTDRPLDVVSGGVVDTKSYGTAIFFQFLSERFGDRAVLSLLEAVRDGYGGVANPSWFEQLDPELARGYGSSFALAFTEFAVWNLFTGDRADATRSYARGRGYPRVNTEAVAFPLALSAPRFFPASIRYFSGTPGGREVMTAALASPSGDPTALASLRLLMTRVDGPSVRAPRAIEDLGAGRETIDVAGADEVITLVVNTAREGSSLRPDLCVGAPDEVDACLRAASSPPDAGVGDAGAEGPDSGLQPPLGPDGHEGCGCEVSPRSSGQWHDLIVLLLFMGAGLARGLCRHASHDRA